jgi:hypothetical protein
VTARDDQRGSDLPKAGVLETIALVGNVVLPTIGKGVLIRRPKVVGMAQRLGLGDRAVHHLRKLRAKYGPGPLRLSVPARSMAVVLEPSHVPRILDSAPEPFAPAAQEKRAALAHFEPKVALATRGPKRQDRRRFNEQVLDFENPVHPLAERLLAVVEEEAGRMLAEVARDGQLTWDRFTVTWHCMVRRLVLGDAARDDHELTDMLAQLRRRGNWAFLMPKDRRLRKAFHDRLNSHLQRAEPGSFAARIASMPKTADTAPSHQVAQWLFAFDPGAMATFRALALLAAHPEQLSRAREEIGGRRPSQQPLLPFLRACLLESLRLWATTPAVLRETTAPVDWENGRIPKNTTLLIFAPYFHRDEEHLAYAHRFTPDIWLDGTSEQWPLVPFSRGPAVCPARNLVPMLASGMLAAIISEHQVVLEKPMGLDRPERLPGTLDNYALSFIVRPLDAARRTAAVSQGQGLPVGSVGRS